MLHKRPYSETMTEGFIVAALYQFATLPDYVELREPIAKCCEANGIKGTLLLAREGINGTVCGPREGIDRLLAHLRHYPALAELSHKESHSDEQSFYRMKVRLKKEIVTMGIEGVDPNKSVGTYVDAEDWNQLISDPEVILIDARNIYECKVGTFRGAIDPNIDTFREFPDYVRKELAAHKDKKVAMFCTGGIRCEKASSFLLDEGFQEVFHLKDGILKYLENIPEKDSLWEGDCFVFDQRVAVGHGLKQGDFQLCYGCQHPLAPEDLSSEHYEEGVSCEHCYGTISQDKLERLRERRKQTELAKERQDKHLGQDRVSIRQRREEKLKQKQLSRGLSSNSAHVSSLKLP